MHNFEMPTQMDASMYQIYLSIYVEIYSICTNACHIVPWLYLGHMPSFAIQQWNIDVTKMKSQERASMNGKVNTVC